MATHAEKRILPYRQEQLFNVVAKVEDYPEFLPWCIGCRIKQRRENFLIADLVIGYKMVRERFTSEVTLTPNERVDVKYTDGPFRYLDNHWIFVDNGDGTTTIDFFIDFEFRSVLLQKMMGAFFNEAVNRMVQAFEDRAHKLYSSS